MTFIALALALPLFATACAAPNTASASGGSQEAQSADVPASADALAPATYVPIARSGARTSKPRKAAIGTFLSSGPAAYPDGVSVTVRRVTPGSQVGQGPGVFPGQRYIAMTLTLSDGGTAPIDLNSIVVTTTYGIPAHTAAPVYDDPAARDFSGILRPGGTATATYLFAIPATERAHARSFVDFDSVHAAAEFAGAIGQG